MSWLKWKKALATLDVVVNRVRVRPRAPPRCSVGLHVCRPDERKLFEYREAYSGLTDVEIAEMTIFFKRHHTFRTLAVSVCRGPLSVLEVAFNGIQKSGRHESGYALRFPRIVRIRHDKVASEVDTLETVEKIYKPACWMIPHRSGAKARDYIWDQRSVLM